MKKNEKNEKNFYGHYRSCLRDVNSFPGAGEQAEECDKPL